MSFFDGQVNIGSSAASTAKAPAAGPAPKTSGGFFDDVDAQIGAPAPAAVATTPEVQKMVQNTSITPPKTESLFSKFLDAINPIRPITPSKKEAAPTTPKNPYVISGLDYTNTSANPEYIARTQKELEDGAKTIDRTDPAAVDAYNKKLEDLNTQLDAQKNLEDFTATHGSADEYDQNLIKLPFANAGVDLNSSKFFQNNSLLTGLLKGVIELPERAIRTLGEGTGLSKPLSGYSIYGGLRSTKPTKYQIPSYAEAAGKTTEQLINEGVPVTAAVILSSAAGAGEFANNALIYEGALSAGSKAITRSLAIPTESQAVAYDFLGQPKTIAEAEKNFKAIQREFHPDKVGSAGQTVSAKANEAIGILREEGIPSTTKFKQGINALLNKPISELFGGAEKVPAGFKPDMPIKGYLEAQNPIHEARSVLNDEINTAIETHGEEVTQQALAENIGVSNSVATKMIQNAKTAAFLKAPEQFLQLSAPKPEEPGASTFFEGDVAIGKTAEEAKQTPPQEVTLYRGGKETGSSFSTDKGIAEDFAKNRGGAVGEYTLKPDAKIADYNDFPDIQYENMSDDAVDRHAVATGQTRREFMDGALEEDYDLAAKWAKEQGYDAIKFPTEGEIRIINKDIVKTPANETPEIIEKGNEPNKPQVPKEESESSTPSQKLKPVGGGERVASELASGIEARAIEKKLTDKPFSSLSMHERGVMEEQRAGATKLYAEDKDLAMRIAMGEENAPEGQLPSVIYQKVVEEAEKSGDIDTMMKLATSPFNDEITAMAQNIRGLAEFRNKTSPTEIIKKVSKTRKAVTEKKAKKAGSTEKVKEKIVERGRKAVAKKRIKSPVQMKQVDDFISLLEC